MDEADIIPVARDRVAARLADAGGAAVGLETCPAVAAAVTECDALLKKLLMALPSGLAATPRAEKIEP